MSLINDALKRAQQTPPVIASGAAPAPLQPMPQNPVSVAGWLIPAVVIFLIVAAVFFIGWAMAHRSLRTEEAVVATPPGAVVKTENATTVPAQPVVEKPVPPVATVPAPKPEPIVVNPRSAPKLEGIFFSPASSTAILDGQTVQVGDTFKQYQVRAIDKTSVTLLDADGRMIKVVMNH
jgi:hypothetical protein